MAEPVETTAESDDPDDEFSIASVSQYLIDRAVPLAVCVSPTDAGSTVR